VNDRDLLRARGEAILVELELVGRLERVVTADGDQRVHADRAQPLVNSLQRRRTLGVFQVRRVRHHLAGVRAGRADEYAALAPCTAEDLVIDHHIVVPLDQRLIGRVVDEARVAVLDAHDLDAVPEEGDCRGGDNRVGRWRRSAGKQDGDPLEGVVVLRGTGEAALGHVVAEGVGREGRLRGESSLRRRVYPPRAGELMGRKKSAF
jgi:hypothetical protein